MQTVAFIPARKGSKGLPGKNTKLFSGKPLVQWSIEQAAATKLFDHIIVSSDDPDVLRIAKDCGNKKIIPVDRHPELVKDDTTVDEVLYDFFARPENKCKYICLLNPTSPLRSVEDIKQTYKFITMKKYWNVISVKWSDYIGWIETPNNKGPLPSYNVNKRPNRQSRNDFFLENGAIYWLRHEMLMAYGHIIFNPLKVKLYEMPLERSLEIDTLWDFYMAEKAYEYTSMAKTS